MKNEHLLDDLDVPFMELVPNKCLHLPTTQEPADCFKPGPPALLPSCPPALQRALLPIAGWYSGSCGGTAELEMLQQ